MEMAVEKLKGLYEIHDHFFTKDAKEKQKRLAGAVDEVCHALDAVGEVNSRTDRAQVAYIRGRAKDVFEQYSSESEQLLSSAVKLESTNIDAWNALGHCVWKKGDLLCAKDCFEGSLEQKKNKEALRQLSMILRQLRADQDGKTHNIKKSVTYAKEAVSLDVNDGTSWYIAGNAYLSLFFSVSHSSSDLERALASYTQADARGDSANPDLHFNRATVCQYKQDFNNAVTSYLAAAKVDPSLPAHESIDMIVRYVTRVHDLIQRNGRIKAKKFVSLVAELSSVNPSFLPPKYEQTTLSALTHGKRATGKYVALKLLVPASVSDQPPVCLVMVDGKSVCVAVCVYHLGTDVPSRWSSQDVFCVLNPLLKPIELKHGRTDLQYDFLVSRIKCNN
jgi:tetratricopeptide (TPR) repeat protein